MKITKIQDAALATAVNLIDWNDPIKREQLLTLIYGILNIEVADETTITTIPINPNDGNDKIHINIPDSIKNVPDAPTPPFLPGDKIMDPAPWMPKVWYNHEPEPIQTDARENVRYKTEVTCTGDKNCIVHTTNTADVQYNGEIEYEEPKIK